MESSVASHPDFFVATILSTTRQANARNPIVETVPDDLYFVRRPLLLAWQQKSDHNFGSRM